MRRSLEVTQMFSGDLHASFQSPGFNVSEFDNVAIQGVFTDTDAVGTFGIDGSLDGTNWSPITLSAAPTAASANGNFLIEITQLACPIIRLTYSRTSGGAVSTCVARIFAKQVY